MNSTAKYLVWGGFLLAPVLVIASQIIATALHPAGTVHLPMIFSSDDPFRLPYIIGAQSCHQMSNRSFFLNGNQYPVCHRCFAIEIGIFIAACATIIVQPRGNFFSSLYVFLPPRIRSRSAVIIAGLALMLPMVIDGSLQLVTSYISSTPQRLITGFFFGIGYTGIIIGIICSVIHYMYLAVKRMGG